MHRGRTLLEAPLTRGRFIRAAGALGASLALAGCGARRVTGRGSGARVPRPDGSSGTAIVVGAGAAGLAAARALAFDDVDVTVLEASGNVGGRLRTSTRLDAPVDMGASWIEGAVDNPIMEFVRAGDIGTVVSGDEVAVYADGDRLAAGQVRSAVGRLADAIDRARSWAEAVPSDDPSLGAALRATGTRLDRDAQLHAVATGELDNEYAASADELSAWEYDSDGELDGDFLLLPGGYVQVADQLAQGLPIELNVRVERIRQLASGEVRVRARDGREWRADRVVVAVPLPALARLQFDPPLPTSHRAAMGRLGMGTFNKVALRFDEQFWPDVDVVAIANPGARIVEWLNLARVVGEPILVGLAGGDAGRWVEASSDAVVRRRVLADMARAAGEAVPAPVGMEVRRWGSDPNFGGAYSYRPPGASMRDHAALGEPVSESLAIAGEATDPRYPSTVHGAIRSGRRAARAVARNGLRPRS